MNIEAFQSLKKNLQGEFFFDGSVTDNVQLLIYSTDASVYSEKPMAVAIPATIKDIQTLIAFALQHQLTLIPRAAGTSLAGQVVGNGIVVDISKHFNKVIEINVAEKWVMVQPGVIRDDLNRYLKKHGLFFGPETSTSNRAMIGGMVGNNSCGLHSIVWGSVRENILEVKALLSDGSEVLFSEEENYEGLQKQIDDSIKSLLGNDANQQIIQAHSPNEKVTRRNTGYALDSLAKMNPFKTDGENFNLSKLIAGSEGTLVFITAVKLKLIDLPPKESALVCVHAHSISDALLANKIAITHQPMASELVDKYIMDFTKEHPVYKYNRFFIEGDPAAILMVEFMADDKATVNTLVNNYVDALKLASNGYAYPILYNEQTTAAWDIRKAGLGLLRNLPGDAQPVNLIEDCAVAPEDLPAYINDIQALLAKHHTHAAYYAHAGAGELHIEPIINLKTTNGVATFRNILAETVEIVKRYNGSLSGEHGDGRLRGEFIEARVGAAMYGLFKEVKSIFDPNNIFNKGKIVDAPSMDKNLRIEVDREPAKIKTHFDFSASGGILRLAEKCSGSGDCRRSQQAGGTMCPSYMATRNEKDTTRARANILREFLSNEKDSTPLLHEEINEVMDLCLSCKGCKSECPTGVDITKLKAEFLQQYHDKNGIPFRSKLIGNFSHQMQLASLFPKVYNFILSNNFLRKKINSLVGFHPERTMPLLGNTTLKKWFERRLNADDRLLTTDNRQVKKDDRRLTTDDRSKNNDQQKTSKKKPETLYFFCDEFTNYYDVEIGKKAILLLEALGYHVVIPLHKESGRTFLSKGMVKKAAEIINENIGYLSPLIKDGNIIVGIEPSAILTFRDEYIDLATAGNKAAARLLGEHTFTIEEFIAAEYLKGNISSQLFTKEEKQIALHGHCYQKVLSSQGHSSIMLGIPENYSVQIIPSGCCGMAGSFGYEKEHYDISQQIGELVLFPSVRQLKAAVIVAAAGTSCRHQVKDGTGKIAKHPVEILWDALLDKKK
jgi:FAD/FMN-containing dehydrogenase/Fe-S oxidoreductase